MSTCKALIFRKSIYRTLSFGKPNGKHATLDGQRVDYQTGPIYFYIQPVYLKSSCRLQIPELQRIIVSEGRLAVMEASLDEAHKKLWQRMQSELKQVDERYPPLSPEAR